MKPQQKPSHAYLLRDRSKEPPPTTRSRPAHLDAIIIPASRPASWFTDLIWLSAVLGAVLVVICSRQTKVEQLATRIARVPGARGLLIDVRNPPDLGLPTRTSAERFQVASAGRVSDLSLKRNLGLLIARRHGWRKVAFVDDDITHSRPSRFTRMAAQLESHQIVGMVCRSYPDSSVACHARRLARLPQDNFVTGAVLGVNCVDLPIPFFPNIYNEDWLFFSNAALQRELCTVGDAIQLEYDPFASPARARHEEFGDVVAEGLFTIIGDALPDTKMMALLMEATTTSYWKYFVDARSTMLDDTRDILTNYPHDDNSQDVVNKAIQSLNAAVEQQESIDNDLYPDFVDAWWQDAENWAGICQKTHPLRSTRDAMDALGIENWRVARFGDPDVASAHVPLLVKC